MDSSGYQMTLEEYDTRIAALRAEVERARAMSEAVRTALDTARREFNRVVQQMEAIAIAALGVE